MQELKQAIKQEAIDTRKTQLLLSIKAGALKPTIDAAYEVPEITRYSRVIGDLFSRLGKQRLVIIKGQSLYFCFCSEVDFLSIMTYDYHGSWEKVTGHNSPLFKSSLDQGTHAQHNIVRDNPFGFKYDHLKI